MRAPSLPSSEVVCTPSRPKEWQKPKSTDGSMKQHSLASLGLHPSTATAHTCAELLSLFIRSAWQQGAPLPCHAQLQNGCAEMSCSPELSKHDLLTRDGLWPESESAFRTPPQQRPAWVVWFQWLDFPRLLSQTYSISPPFSILSSSPLLVMVSWQNLPGSQFQRSWKSSRQ